MLVFGGQARARWVQVCTDEQAGINLAVVLILEVR